MKPAGSRFFPRSPGRRLRGWLLHLTWPALAAGCVQLEMEVGEPQHLPPPAAVKAQQPAPEPVPAPKDRDHCTAPPTLTPAKEAPQAECRVMPIDLDTVLRLVGAQNRQVALARERLGESWAEKDLADLSWIPTLYGGVAYYRHEGGIQNEIGTLTRSSTQALYPALDLAARLDLRESMYQKLNAERKVIQQQGEVAKVTSETLLEAANTYVDLLAARTSLVVLERTEAYQQEALKWAEKQFKEDPKAEVLVESIRAQAAARRQAYEELKQQGDAASAKLAYLLGLGHDVVLVPADERLQPIDVVDANRPTPELVDQALASGPGVRELEQLIGLIEHGIDQAGGRSRFLPALELRVQEGGFGAGPGGDLNWDDRFDMGLQLRWNLSEGFTARERLRVAQSKAQQARLTYEDLKGKLALGVQEARQSILSGRSQLKLGSDQVNHACKTYNLFQTRLKENLSTTTEVMAAIRLLEVAHLNTLNSIRMHNKAQVRLMVLLGAAGAGGNCHE